MGNFSLPHLVTERATDPKRRIRRFSSPANTQVTIVVHRFDFVEQRIYLRSFEGIWKVVSKTTSKRDGLIHRLTTKDLESIHKQDLHNGRTTPRTYVCLKEIDAFELIIHANGRKNVVVISSPVSFWFVRRSVHRQRATRRTTSSTHSRKRRISHQRHRRSGIHADSR